MAANIPNVVVVAGTYIDLALKCSRIPLLGHRVVGSELSYNLAGPGPCQAVEAALCGCNVHLITKIGDDPFGQIIKTQLNELKVNTDFIFTAQSKNTGVFVTMVNTDGGNASCIYQGANAALNKKDIEDSEQIIAGADVCLIHGRLPQDAIVAAIRTAKLHARKVILNPTRPIQLKEQQKTDLPLEYFNADILIANLVEAADIAEQTNTNIHTAKLIGADLIARGVKNVVITLGKRGCLVIDRDNTNHIPAFEIELVDKTAGGDAFTGALAAYYAVKDDLKDAVKFASAAAALTCSKFGAIESLPTKTEIIELLQKQDI